ncbi:hypothetical protein JW890_01895, partial [candidate division WOR-3 bacterium]|nr:hypothetical protein [candidate division WOR-3 bacterium]
YIENPPFSGFLFSPALGLVSFLFYKIAGTNAFSAVLPGLFFCLLAAFAVFLSFGKTIRGLVASCFILFSYPLTVYGRTPLAENASTCFLMFAVFFIVKNKYLSAGIFTAAAILFTKIHAVSFLPAGIIYISVKNKKSLINYFAGIAVVFAFWFIFLYLPFKEMFNSYFMSGLKSVTENQKADIYLFFYRVLGAGIPDLTFSTPFVVFSGFFAAAFIARQNKIGDIQLLALCWLGSLIVFYTVFFPYRPARFLLYFVYAAAILVSSFGEHREKGVSKGKRSTIPVLIFSLFFSYQFTAFSLRIVRFPLLLVSSAVSVAVVILTRYVSRKADKFIPYLIALLCILHFSCDNYRIISWLLFPMQSVKGASFEIESIVGERALIAGSLAPALTLGTEIKSLAAFDWMIDSGFIEKYGVTHLIISGFDSSGLSDYLSRSAAALRPFVVGGDLYMLYLTGKGGYYLTDYEKSCLFLQEKALDSAVFYLKKYRETNIGSSSAWLLGALVAQKTGDSNLVHYMISEGIKTNPNDAFLVFPVNHQIH